MVIKARPNVEKFYNYAYLLLARNKNIKECVVVIITTINKQFMKIKKVYITSILSSFFIIFTIVILYTLCVIRQSIGDDQFVLGPKVANANLNQLKHITNVGNLKPIPILTYHCVDDTIWGYKPMFVSVKTFDEQMKCLKDQGYSAITFRDLDNLNIIKKPVIITFDDGYENNYTNAFPILKKYNMKATIFVISNAIGHQKYLKTWQIKEMRNLIDFESHTVSHPYLDKLSAKEIENELMQSQEYLQKLLDTKIDVVAYPYGSYSDKVIKITKKYYKYGVTTNSGDFYYKHSNDYHIKRISIHDDINIEKFISLLKMK